MGCFLEIEWKNMKNENKQISFSFTSIAEVEFTSIAEVEFTSIAEM